MAANVNPTPNMLQPRRYSGQKKPVNMRGHTDALRTSFYKQAYTHGARNEVDRNENLLKKTFFRYLGNGYQ
jgi:hypothetical protein